MRTESATCDPRTVELVLRLGPMSAAMVLDFLAISVPLPALPLHVINIGFGTAVVGLAVDAQSLAAVVSRPTSGRMVDARGAKSTLLCGLIASSGAGCLYLASLVVSQTLVSLSILLAGRLVLWVGESLSVANILGQAIPRAGPNRIGRATSWNGMAQCGALAIGAPAGFWLYQIHGYASVAICTALLPLLAVAMVALFDSVTPTGEARIPLRKVVRQV